MVVDRTTLMARRICHDGASMRRVALVLLMLIGAVIAVPAWSDSLVHIRQHGRVPPFRQSGNMTGLASQDQGFDPAAATFSSLLSPGAMSVVAPIVYGDFVSPLGRSSASSFTGIMAQDTGFDPAVSSM